MSDIKITKGLSEKLGENRSKQMEFLINIDNILKPKLEKVKEVLDENTRASITAKMQKLTDFLLEVSSKIKKHISNENKKALLEDLFAGFNLDKFSQELKAEISSTEKILRSKMAKIAKDASNEFSKLADELLKTVDDTKEYISEAKDEAEAQLDEIDEKSLVPYKEPGFIETFKRLLEEKKEAGDKKLKFSMIVSTFFNTFKEIADTKTDFSDGKAEDNSKTRFELQERIGELKKKLNESAKEKAKLGKELAELGKKGLNKAKGILDDAIKPEEIKEITAEKVSRVVDRISEFGKGALDGVKEWKEKVDSLKAEIFDSSIPDEKETIAIPENELEALELQEKAEAKNVSKLFNKVYFSGRDDSTVKGKLIKGISKLQLKVANMKFKQATKERVKQEKYEARQGNRRSNTRNEGMDR